MPIPIRTVGTIYPNYVLQFICVDGSGAKLSVPYDMYSGDPSTFTLNDDHTFTDNTPTDVAAGMVYDPSNSAFGGIYTLTTGDGTVYQINSATGHVATTTDPNGNTTTSDAPEADYTTQVVNDVSNGNGTVTVKVFLDTSEIAAIDYTISSNQLTQVRQEDLSHPGQYLSSTQYVYTSMGAYSNLLSVVNDARGVPVLNATYDDSGELVSLTDAEGHPSSVGNGGLLGNSAVQNVGNSQESVENVYDSFGNVTRVISAIENGNNQITGYSVAVTEYVYSNATPESDLSNIFLNNASGPGATNMNAIVSVRTYQIFTISGTDPNGLRYSQAPTLLLEETDYDTGDGQLSAADPNLHQLSKDSVYLGQDSSGNYLYRVTNYGSYVLGKPGTLAESLETRTSRR